MSLLKQDTTKKERVDKNVTKFKAGINNKKYKLKEIWHGAVYAKKSAMGYLLSFYYLITKKDFLKEKNTWEPTLAVKYLQ